MPALPCAKGEPTSRPCHTRFVAGSWPRPPPPSGTGSVIARPSFAAGSPHCRASASNDPPSTRVAEVITTVERPNSRLASRPATDSGATCRARVGGPSRGSRSLHQTTSGRVAGSSRSNAASSRPATSWTSSTRARANLRAVASSSRPPFFSRSGPSACRHDHAASRTEESIRPTASGRASQRPTGASASTVERPSPASRRASATAWSTSFPQRRDAAAVAAAVSSPVATDVTRSTRLWASSTTTVSCSGRIARPSMASIASMAWLVTTTSDFPAANRACSEKHSSATGHREAPRHSRADTDTCRHARSVTPGTSSSRSPVRVVSAHSCSRVTWRPSAETWNGVEELVVAGGRRRRPGPPSRPCGGRGSSRGP